MKVFLRKTHRWLGLLMALQIIAWMGSGLYFSIFPIAEIRGEHLTREPERPSLVDLASAGPAQEIRNSLEGHFGREWTLSSVGLASLDGQVSWKVEGTQSGLPFRRLVKPGGGVVPMMNRKAAEKRARWWLLESTPAVDIEWVEPGSGDIDFRGREAPAWKVSFEGTEPVSLYLDPWTGELLARRTSRWRVFDFLWMLHIMDYDTRDDFNHLLLQVAAAFGLLAAMSGIVYWSLTSRLFRRRNGRHESGA